MAHNITLSYGGVTPSMAVFGTLPNGFYDPESRGIMSVVGAQETDVTVFEKAMRIRQTALAQAHQAVIEDRVARAARTRQDTPARPRPAHCRYIRGGILQRGEE